MVYTLFYERDCLVNHPYLFQGAEPRPPCITGDHLIENAGEYSIALLFSSIIIHDTPICIC